MFQGKNQRANDKVSIAHRVPRRIHVTLQVSAISKEAQPGPSLALPITVNEAEDKNSKDPGKIL